MPEGVPRNAEGIPLIVDGAANYFIALHVLNGLTILAVSVVVFLRARRLAARKDDAPVAVGP